MALIIEDLHALRGREGMEAVRPSRVQCRPEALEQFVDRVPKAWQTMVNAACARDFPACSFWDLVTAVSTVQGCTICETIFESEAALRTHMKRVHGNWGLTRLFVADTQCLVCKKSFVTRHEVQSTLC